MKVLDLFSGIGGFSLGLERAGMETVAFCEIEPFCQKVLHKHWPDVPIYDDIKELTNDGLKADGITDIDLICGGYPCQPFSTAAAGKNPPDLLSGEMLRLVGEIRPGYVIAENTEKKAFSEAFIYQLRKLGYEIIPKCIGAHEIGADHERSRWWLCAYTHHKGELSFTIDAEMARMSKVCASVWSADSYSRAVRVPNGVSRKMDRNRLKALGNAVVPQIPELIGRAIMEAA